MTKADIVKQIAERTGVEREVVSTIVENFMEQIRLSMIHGENIYLRGFGTFLLKQRAEKVARNISKIRRLLFLHIRFRPSNLRRIL